MRAYVYTFFTRLNLLCEILAGKRGETYFPFLPDPLHRLAAKTIVFAAAASLRSLKTLGF
jgi:hypothetical protein